METTYLMANTGGIPSYIPKRIIKLLCDVPIETSVPFTMKLILGLVTSVIKQETTGATKDDYIELGKDLSKLIQSFEEKRKKKHEELKKSRGIDISKFKDITTRDKRIQKFFKNNNEILELLGWMSDIFIDKKLVVIEMNSEKSTLEIGFEILSQLSLKEFPILDLLNLLTEYGLFEVSFWIESLLEYNQVCVNVPKEVIIEDKLVKYGIENVVLENIGEKIGLIGLHFRNSLGLDIWKSLLHDPISLRDLGKKLMGYFTLEGISILEILEVLSDKEMIKSISNILPIELKENVIQKIPYDELIKEKVNAQNILNFALFYLDMDKFIKEDFTGMKWLKFRLNNLESYNRIKYGFDSPEMKAWIMLFSISETDDTMESIIHVEFSGLFSIPERDVV